MWQTLRRDAISISLNLLNKSIKGVTTRLRGKKHREITDCPEIFLVHVHKETTI